MTYSYCCLRAANILPDRGIGPDKSFDRPIACGEFTIQKPARRLWCWFRNLLAYNKLLPFSTSAKKIAPIGGKYQK
ncbi:MAG: hypothetical protein HC894_23775 [Microcoleus sp. SM1_3_4]|nr:hypothetical protein [Microcoleus sp. SM1_3_4]